MKIRLYLSTGIVGLVTVVGFACGGDDSTGPPPIDPPVVTGISATNVSPGDTLVITGSKFATPASANTVTFKNPTSATKAFQVSATELRVVVDRDATDGPVTVANAGGADQTEAIRVQRGLGDVFVFGGLGTNQVLALPNPTGATQYLVVPHATSAQIPFNQDQSYVTASENATPVVATASSSRASGKAGRIGPKEWFEARRWDDAEAMIQRFGAPRTAFDAPAAPGAAVLPIRSFYVLKTTSGSQDLASSYQRIYAELRYTGTKCLVYADVDTLPTGNFTQAHLNTFGQTFDNSIEATNVSYFGAYSDVDGNDRVILLVTPVVNRLQEQCPAPCTCGFIAGFFNPRDLFTSPPVPAGTTNHAEILYLLAADPNGFWDCQFPVDATADENLSTIPHEHEHLISFSQRIFFQGSTYQARWLEEGMAHMAEDLNGDNSSNESRGALYRADPGGISLEDTETPLEQRGGIYLMLRLLVDRYGTGILKQIVQSKCTGRACIQNVTGMYYADVLAEFLAAQYLSGKGITPDPDPRFNYASIDLADFGSLIPDPHVAGAGDVTGTVLRSAGDFHVFTGVLNNETRFTFTNPGGQAGLRHVVVRIQE